MAKSNLRQLLTLVCASVVADYDRSWRARPVVQLIPEGGPRPERISRAKAKLQSVFADLVEAATRRGRRPRAPREDRAPLLGALLAVATRPLALSAVPVRRRAVQDELICAFDRVHAPIERRRHAEASAPAARGDAPRSCSITQGAIRLRV